MVTQKLPPEADHFTWLMLSLAQYTKAGGKVCSYVDPEIVSINNFKAIEIPFPILQLATGTWHINLAALRVRLEWSPFMSNSCHHSVVWACYASSVLCALLRAKKASSHLCAGASFDLMHRGTRLSVLREMQLWNKDVWSPAKYVCLCICASRIESRWYRDYPQCL